MTELVKKLSAIPDAYDDFILGVISYAKKKPEHITALLDYMDNNEGLNSSDIVRFIAMQPDFNDYNVNSVMVG